MFTVTGMDHIVLNVRDMATVLDFYINVLGLPGERLDEFHQGKVSFPSVRINEHTLIDLFPMPHGAEAATPGGAFDLNHFCLVIEKTNMPDVIAHLEQHGVPILQGPVTRWGAHGNGTSIYLQDPEKRQIEIRYYEP
jgi:catechol 2,3-dioxygenase-like lactoylglutathione lyase family enzyme